MIEFSARIELQQYRVALIRDGLATNALPAAGDWIRGLGRIALERPLRVAYVERRVAGDNSRAVAPHVTVVLQHNHDLSTAGLREFTEDGWKWRPIAEEEEPVR